MPRILVVDDDPWILKMVCTVLGKRGHDVQVGRDGKEGLDKAKELRPDLIITDIMMPEMDGWDLVRNIRATPGISMVPVIFLTALSDDDDRIQGFRLGADDYLAKPFRFDELELRVEKAFRSKARLEDHLKGGAPKPRLSSTDLPAAGIRGTLDQIGLSSLLVMMEMERKSGILVLRNDQVTARLFLKEGRILAARFEGRSEPRGAEVIYELLRWTQGKFDFNSLEVDMEDELQSSTTHLLLEGARRLDEGGR
ncbi:MAG: response regulator [Polyangia bacterium]|nr:response regulator [Polyangia bacterium]